MFLWQHSICTFLAWFADSNDFVPVDDNTADVSLQSSESNPWSNTLLDLLCSMHIPKLRDYNEFGKTEKEAVSINFNFKLSLSHLLSHSLSPLSPQMSCLLEFITCSTGMPLLTAFVNTVPTCVKVASRPSLGRWKQGTPKLRITTVKQVNYNNPAPCVSVGASWSLLMC